MTFRFTSVARLACVGLILSNSACSAFGAPALHGDGDGDGDSSSSTDTGSSSSTSGSSGSTTSGTTTGSTTDSGGDTGDGGQPILPARIRRLTNAEYNASVQALTGTSLTPGDDFPPDARQQGYTLNEAQRVDPVLARQLDAAATAIADEVVAKIDQLAPCSGGDETACASTFIDSFGSKAYRRPLTDEDAQALSTLYEAGASGATYADGIHQVVRGILQSPGFLYLTEIGDGTGSDTIQMTDHEIAASLSYLLTGGPPDDALLTAADSGSLAGAEGRQTEARRLLQSDAGKQRGIRIVREWLGIDRIATTAKDSTVYPDYGPLRDTIAKETDDFVGQVLDSSGGDVTELLGATWTVADQGLAQMYGVGGSGRVDVPERPGLLNRAAFLAVYSHAQETGPVLRGANVLRKLVCDDIQLPPAAANLVLTPPVPDPNKTTRERFEIHAADPVCAHCHDKIDVLGFSFEQFDGMGKKRTMENNQPIDSATAVALGYDFDGSYANSTELLAVMATSIDVRECFARQMFRASAGEANAKTAEEAFVDAWSTLEDTEQKSLIEILVKFASSDFAAQRRQP